MGAELTRMLNHGLQHPVALIPSPPEGQGLVLIEELLQVGGRGGMGGAEVEGAIPGVTLWRANKGAVGKGQASLRSHSNRASGSSISLSPCSKTTGFLSARACLISIWQ